MPQKNMYEGIVWRIVATILVVVVFLIGSLLYVGFYASGFNLIQDIVIVLVALIVAWAVIAITWITWAHRRGFMKLGRWH